MADLDERLAGAVERWIIAHREALLAREVAVSVDGPHRPNGTMDPVYLVRLNSVGAEAEAVLFEGGMLLLATLNATGTAQESHIDAVAEEQVTEALTLLAQGV